MSPTGSGTMDGSTWENAMPFTQFPSKFGETTFKNIYLKEGNYTLTALAAVEDSQGVYVQGGFPSTASGTNISGYDPVAHPTIIGAVTNGAYIRINNKYQQKNVTIKGVAFTGNWGQNNVILMNSQGSEVIPMYPLLVTLEDLHIYNVVTSTAEGILQCKIMHEDTRISIKNNLFENNINNGASVIGLDNAGLNTGSGGVQGGSDPYFAVIENNSFIANRSNADNGPAISTSSGGGSDLLIKNNYFCSNYSGGRGGALYFQTSNRITIKGNRFNANEARYYGSAIFVLEGVNQIPGYIIDNNTFYGNLPSEMTDLNLPRDCCSGGAVVGVTNNTFDKPQSGTIIGNFGGVVKTPSPYTGNIYNVTTDPGNCPTNIGEPDIIADIYSSKTDGVTQYTPGASTIYTIIIGNNGPGNVLGISVTDPVPTGIPASNVSYTALVSGGATTTVSGSQTGAINDMVDLPNGGTVTYTVTVDIPIDFTGDLVNTVSTTIPNGVSDTDTGNDNATDTNTQSAASCQAGNVAPVVN